MIDDTEFLPMLCVGLFVGVSWLVTVGFGWLILRREKSANKEEKTPRYKYRRGWPPADEENKDG